MSALLSVEDLRTSLPTRRGRAVVVDAVSFEVLEGESVGLVGESGCGKTMTALSVLGLLPTGGAILPGSSVRFAGEELVGAPGALWQRLRGREIGLVFQEPAQALNPVMSVGDQVGEGVRHHVGASRQEARARTLRLLEEVGLPDPEGVARRFPHELSGGMKQRVLIAMALACEPRLLIADEPATALDPTVRAQIAALLGELRARRGLSLLLITHDLALVSELCTRVIVMYAGEVVETGTSREVFARPRHPYTEGLLDCIPGREDQGGRLRTIAGRVPDLSDRPGGCRFAPRCPRAWDRCREEAPPLFSTGAPETGATARCWLVAEAPTSGDGGADA